MSRRALFQALPFIILATCGATGLAFAALPSAKVAAPVALDEPPTSVETSPFVVEADFDRRVLPENGKAYLRVALEGREGVGHALPAEVHLVIDRSWSMRGEKMRHAKAAAIEAIDTLHDGDLLHVIAFGSSVSEIACGPVNEHTRENAKLAIARLNPTGGTKMLEALQFIGEPKAFDGVRRVFLVSDGHPDEARGLKSAVAKLAASGVVTTTLGIGLDYNEDLMERLADAGRGNYYFVERTERLASIFAREIRDLSEVVARNVVVDVASSAGLKLRALGVPQSVRWSAEGPRVAVGDLYANTPVELLFEVPLSAFGDSPDARVTVRAGEEVVEARARAVFSRDEEAIARSAVPEVQVQVAKWHSSRVWLSANASFNGGDFATANGLLDDEIARLEALTDVYKSAQLARELAAVRQFQFDNNSASSSRRALNNYAKWRSREMNR